ncbi:MAG: oligonucleotide/oligosaccharide-binding fold domain-containing protein [bacterium]|nr:oligonucleotide/oligosaccharide-binding fold domain-containing protein [bacterium]
MLGRTDLPIAAHRHKIIEAVKNNQVVIIVGETGSGKTTQTPLYLVGDGFTKIGVTQPRRLAATSVAEYVAGQLGTRVGEDVGYKIRFDDRTAEGTLVKFMTDGILLQEARNDPNFSAYNVLVLDECHERSLNTDFCLGLVKRALVVRPELRVVVMSATIDAEKFSDFFNRAPVLNVEGRMYEVSVNYIDQSFSSNARDKFGYEFLPEGLAALKVAEIHRSGKAGDILVFMTSKAQINRVIELIGRLELSGLVCLPAHGEMSVEEQRRILEPANVRKVIVATNVAETSITIDGVVYVLDSGLINQTNFDPITGIGSLKPRKHSKAGLAQRAGRAGRTQPGVCWRLFREEEFDYQRPDFTEPEIQRTDLSGVVLRMLGLRITRPEDFEFVDNPSWENIQHALEALTDFEAITSERTLTEIGERLLDLPLEPRIGRMILAAEDYGCVEEIVTIAAALSAKEIFFRPQDDKKYEAKESQRKFLHPRSDLLTRLNAIYWYEREGRNRQVAEANFLNSRSLDEIINIRDQLLEVIDRSPIQFSRLGFLENRDRTDEERAVADKICKAIAAGLIQNIAKADWNYAYRMAKRGSVFIHPGSVLFHFGPNLLVCENVVESIGKRGAKTYARNNTAIKPDWIVEIAPHMIRAKSEGDPYWSAQHQAYVVTESLYFRGTAITSREARAQGPEVVARFARDLAGYQNLHPCQEHNRIILRELELINRRSGGVISTPLPTRLETFYLEALGEATSVAETEDKELFLRVSDFVGEQALTRWGSICLDPRSPLWDPSRAEKAVPIVEKLRQRIRELKDEHLEIERELRTDWESWNASQTEITRTRSQLIHLEIQLNETFFEKEIFESLEAIEGKLQNYAHLKERRATRRTEEARREDEAREKARRASEEALAERRVQEAAEKEWETYLANKTRLEEEYRSYHEFGLWCFKLDLKGNPLAFQRDSATYHFDTDNFLAIPDGVSDYWGCVSQEYTISDRPHRKVAILLEVMEEPDHLQVTSAK